MPQNFLTPSENWSMPLSELYARLDSTEYGLSHTEATSRLKKYGHNELERKQKRSMLWELALSFVNPLNALLLVVATIEFFLDNPISSFIIYIMVIVSGALTFYQEYSAKNAAEKLRKMVSNTATVLRKGEKTEVRVGLIVPGDVVFLSSGDMVPADCRVLSAKDFFINQASLTGESFPIEKAPSEGSQKNGASNVLYFGSSVVSGSATAVVVTTGRETQFGQIAKRLSESSEETTFEKGIKDYRNLMVKFVVVLVLGVFLINAALKHDLLGAILFALAVAVGLTPEMLPVIVAANLSKGSMEMSKKQVIVKRLAAIQNLGAIDVLCTDKTGTLTEDKVKLVRHLNLAGEEDRRVLSLAYANSYFQTGLKNLMDTAIMEFDSGEGGKDINDYSKVDEIPFDFGRRRMSVIVSHKKMGHVMLVKGAPESIFSQSTGILINGKTVKLTKSHTAKAHELYNKLSADGYRVLALASRQLEEKKAVYSTADESSLILEGFLAFLDPPKKTAHSALEHLQQRGVEIKIISGDNELVNRRIAQEVGLKIKGIVTEKDIIGASNESLAVIVENNTIFARISPIEKERIILALKRNGHSVGYMGDGINDSLALKTADVGISVDTAVDIAKESADVILLHKSLTVLHEGVDEGRKTFVNTVKYLRMGSSSNFGNMFSVVGASILLPFLPMAPIQLILNNFLYDLSQLGIPTDAVDEEAIQKPVKWDVTGIRKFMTFIGPISSLFDYLTFGLMWFVFGATTLGTAALFQSGWFIESIITQTLVIHVIRTNKIPFLQSRASKNLTLLSLGVVATGILIVNSPLAKSFNFAQLPLAYYGALIVMVVAYLTVTQVVKNYLLQKGIIN